MSLTPMLIGSVLALAVAAFAALVGFDRDRAFYPTVLIVVGSYYVLFAVVAGASDALPAELALFALFAALAVAGFRFSPWIAAAGLAGHGLYDLVRADVLPQAGTPSWWPGFCMAYDVVAALVLAALIVRRRPEATGTTYSADESGG